ncbi:hypothetical protein BTI21_03050 [Lactobacillus delbrueckii subsp. bulgaricus]|nr:hypothetical protein [Lactobacillus delbrueckii subsp. bulgaricus]PTE03331.1 hypothetical protein C6364_09795 [Lactobacillus delbrueckii]MBT8808609.1 hypothetical protein [Lactobacillus delbrueckii subsp. bulgaricus]MBT8811822.1 hypothetical protein [Lactobacillus delbrueckii subsp. bulgaricus]MBT8818163.1 hypothetical protein [Lactobacillus delbrueckii subsp. bulgaricus]
MINIKRKAYANSKFLVLLKSSSRTTKLWSFSVDVGSASPEEQMERFTNAFISRLPKYMQEAISPSLAA